MSVETWMRRVGELVDDNAAIRLTVKAILIDLWRVSANQEPRHGAPTP